MAQYQYKFTFQLPSGSGSSEAHANVISDFAGEIMKLGAIRVSTSRSVGSFEVNFTAHDAQYPSITAKATLLMSTSEFDNYSVTSSSASVGHDPFSGGVATTLEEVVSFFGAELGRQDPGPVCSVQKTIRVPAGLIQADILGLVAVYHQTKRAIADTLGLDPQAITIKKLTTGEFDVVLNLTGSAYEAAQEDFLIGLIVSMLEQAAESETKTAEPAEVKIVVVSQELMQDFMLEGLASTLEVSLADIRVEHQGELVLLHINNCPIEDPQQRVEFFIRAGQEANEPPPLVKATQGLCLISFYCLDEASLRENLGPVLVSVLNFDKFFTGELTGIRNEEDLTEEEKEDPVALAGAKCSYPMVQQRLFFTEKATSRQKQQIAEVCEKQRDMLPYGRVIKF